MHVWTVTSFYNARKDVFVKAFASLLMATKYVEESIKDELCLQTGDPFRPEDYNWEVSKYQDSIEYSNEESDHILLIEKQETPEDSNTNIIWAIKPDAPDQSSSDDDWYALAEGGYLKPEQVLQDSLQVEIVRNAVETLQSFFTACHKAGVRNEM